MTRRPGSYAPLGFVLALLLGCGPKPPANPHVVFVLIDTLRADHLTPYGYVHDTAPNLNRLATQSAVFERVIAPSSWTKTSMASILTSRDPHRHGVRRPNDVLPADLTTLAQSFREAGYQTLAVNTNPWLQAPFGFARGFTTYRHLDMVEGRFPTCWDVNRVAAELLAAREPADPVFLALHYMDVHAPYRPSPRFYSAPPVELPGRGPVPDGSLEYAYRKEGLDGPRVQQRVTDLYDAGIFETDAALQQLLDAVFRLLPREDTVVVITSDHGEEFREHGSTEHGTQLYPEVLHVPLIVHAPGRVSPQRVTEQVRSIDVAPTCAALAGLPRPTTFEGEPLLGNGASSGDRMAISAVGLNDSAPDRDLFAVTTREYMFIKDRKGGRTELYQLTDDPGATRDLGSDHAKAKLFEQLADAVGTPAGTQAELDERTMEALREFGYFDR